jgi:alpha-tubulin suppressor-like RCC1 family protein
MIGPRQRLTVCLGPGHLQNLQHHLAHSVVDNRLQTKSWWPHFVNSNSSSFSREFWCQLRLMLVKLFCAHYLCSAIGLLFSWHSRSQSCGSAQTQCNMFKTMGILFLAILFQQCQAQQVSTGWAFTCAVAGPAGTLIVCFGYNGQLQSALRRTAPTGFAQVSVPITPVDGQTSVCSLTAGGQVQCFGSCAHGECIVPATPINQVSVGNSHVCAVNQNSALSCWGCAGANADAGQCNAPVGLFKRVTAGPVHSCALRTNGSLACFGCRGTFLWTFPPPSTLLVNDAGQCSPPLDGAFVDVSAGAWHTCAVTNTGSVLCFGCGGNHDFGQCSSLSGAFTAVASGYVHTCVLSVAGVVQCFGCRGSANVQLASNQCSVPSFSAPQVQISAGMHSSCSVGADSVVTCWGSGPSSVSGGLISPFSDLAMGTMYAAGAALSDGGFLVPLTVGLVTNPAVFNTPFASVAASYTGICVLSAAGSLLCPCNGLVCRPPSGIFKQVSAGYFHMCALAVNGSVFCWGCDDSTKSRPCDAPSGTFKEVAAGVYHSCAVRSDTRVTCWGCQDRASNYSQCVVPAGIVGVTHVSAGNVASCALFADGHSRCWGQAPTPPPFPAFAFASLLVGATDTCGQLQSGSTKCWSASSPVSGQFKLVRPNLSGYGVGGLFANGTLTFWDCLFASYCLKIPLTAGQLSPPASFRLGRQLLPCPAGVLASPFRGYVTEACGGPCQGGTYGVNCANTCPPGSFCPSGSAAPIPCPIGRFSSVSAAAALGACSMCQIGSYCSAPGALAPTFCPAVSYITCGCCLVPFLVLHLIVCVYAIESQLPERSLVLYSTSLCPRNAYLSEWQGRYGASQGLSSLFCTNSCQAGFFCPVGSTSAQQLSCPPGFFSASGAALCSACTAGFATNKSSSVGCTDCLPGRYSAQGSLECFLCAPGQSQGLARQSACVACAPGKAAPSPGSTDCLRCASGTYTPSRGALQCVTCQAGAQSLRLCLST